MTFEPKHLNRWKMPSHYFGAEWPEYFSSGFGQSRDSDALERSNFISALKAIGGETETVKVIRESHWAVGWVEWIAIHESDEPALREADALRDAYNSHYSDTENEEAQAVWKDCYSDAGRLAYIRKHSSQFEFHNFADLLGCARGQYFAGYASELLN
ncbi:MAG TPA: hypothetical protein VGN16_09715 [Acidobacteriaceae bacterium]|jgi:hypothetical protein